jgi:protein TonB
MLFLFVTDAVGQDATDTTSSRISNEIFLFVDSAAMPVGGLDTFYRYIGMNIQYPVVARRSGITGKVIVEFVIEKDGSISSENIKVLKSPHESLSEEAVRLMKNAPKWVPGKLQGIPVRTRKVLPLSFNLGVNPKNK